jgi:uncharacterized membrane-anchored protein
MGPMTKSSRLIKLLILSPIVWLGLLFAFKHYRLIAGTSVILRIKGYDPRDLLAGHYLQFQVEYPDEGVCPRDLDKTSENGAFFCFDDNRFTGHHRESCRLQIKGYCQSGNFLAGIERFYIPQEKAARLEQLIRDRTASIEVSVSRSGSAQIKDLLIDGKPWESVPIETEH